MYRQEFKFSK